MNFADTASSKFNQLGGLFLNGKPLPNSVRQKIIEMAELGIRPCDISRQLKVSHGCISKLLSKYNDTGSFEAGRRTRRGGSEMNSKIEECGRSFPGVLSSKDKEKLLASGLCSRETLLSVPTNSSVVREEGMNDEDRAGPLFRQSFEESEFNRATTIVNNPKTTQLRHYYRRNRIKFLPEQLKEMEAAFCKTRYPDVLMREELGKRLNVSESRLQIWFSNRRSKEKRLRNNDKQFKAAMQQNMSRILYPYYGLSFIPPSQTMDLQASFTWWRNSGVPHGFCTCVRK
ncbi:paired box protein Pax-3-B-like [Montipora capricornis]|uniref:paired box protein Pax-3-B-like n=1 Tax=Montipora capricornis TaxID=246305 RepID=UPI0035F1ED7E